MVWQIFEWCGKFLFSFKLKSFPHSARLGDYYEDYWFDNYQPQANEAPPAVKEHDTDHTVLNDLEIEDNYSSDEEYYSDNDSIITGIGMIKGSSIRQL